MNDTPRIPTLRELFPELDDEQLREAEETLDRYAQIVLRIIERRHLDGGDFDGATSGALR